LIPERREGVESRTGDNVIAGICLARTGKGRAEGI
jgi:hypothetical protein